MGPSVIMAASPFSVLARASCIDFYCFSVRTKQSKMVESKQNV